MKEMTYSQAKFALNGYRWISGWKIKVNIEKEINYYTLDVIGGDGRIIAYATVSKRTAERLKKEWNL